MAVVHLAFAVLFELVLVGKILETAFGHECSIPWGQVEQVKGLSRGIGIDVEACRRMGTMDLVNSAVEA